MKQLLDDILGYIQPEPLLYYLKNSAVNALGQNAAGANSIINSVPVFISESAILKELLPEDLYYSLIENNPVGTFALIFALKHRIAWLNLLFHQSIETAGINSRFGRSIESDQEALGSLLTPDYWFNTAPIAGFSAVGIHLSFRATTTCRAFDYYEILNCSSPAAPVFCNDHQTEKWWHPADNKNRSTQATMFDFYSRKENFLEYDNDSLKKLQEDFWNSFKKPLKQRMPGNPAAALARFQIKDTAELKAIGSGGLRKIYAGLVFKIHPDHGGSNTEFSIISAYYEELKLALETDT